jgi:hypothetical protein
MIGWLASGLAGCFYTDILSTINRNNNHSYLQIQQSTYNESHSHYQNRIMRSLIAHIFLAGLLILAALASQLPV